jgi:hypothetical protein
MNESEKETGSMIEQQEDSIFLFLPVSCEKNRLHPISLSSSKSLFFFSQQKYPQ